jgi:hypothetical protein
MKLKKIVLLRERSERKGHRAPEAELGLKIGINQLLANSFAFFLSLSFI